MITQEHNTCLNCEKFRWSAKQHQGRTTGATCVRGHYENSMPTSAAQMRVLVMKAQHCSDFKQLT